MKSVWHYLNHILKKLVLFFLRGLFYAANRLPSLLDVMFCHLSRRCTMGYWLIIIMRWRNWLLFLWLIIKSHVELMAIGIPWSVPFLAVMSVGSLGVTHLMCIISMTDSTFSRWVLFVMKKVLDFLLRLIIAAHCLLFMVRCIIIWMATMRIF